MSFLAVRPVWSNREPTAQEVEVTNKLYRIYQSTVTGRRNISRQVNAVRNRLGSQPIGAFTGTTIDEAFKSAVQRAKLRGGLPLALRVTPTATASGTSASQKKGPDVWLDRVAWDITTAEQGRAHIARDVHRDPHRWDIYFVLGY
jgi:hypothetical protein